MRSEDRDKRIRELFTEDMALLKLKGRDYSGDTDALRNLKRFGFYGIVVRLSDKFSRLETITKHGGDMAVLDESIIDTLRDIRNYCFLGQVLLEIEGQDTDLEEYIIEQAKTK